MSDDVDWDRNKQMASMLVHDELSDPVGFAERREYEVYLGGFLYGGLGEHNKARREFEGEKLPRKHFVKEGNPIEWTKYSTRTAAALAANKIKPWGRKVVKLPMVTTNQTKKTQRRRVKIAESIRPSTTTTVEASPMEVTQYEIGCKQISEIVKYDPAKRKTLETLHPPEDLASSLEMLACLVDLHPTKNHRKTSPNITPLTAETAFTPVVLSAVIFSVIFHCEDDDLEASTNSATTPQNEAASQHNPLVLLFLSDTMSSGQDVSEHVLLDLLDGWLAVTEAHSCVAATPAVLHRHLTSANPPKVATVQFKGFIKSAVSRGADYYHRQVVDGNLRKLRGVEIGFIQLLEALFPISLVNRLVKRVGLRLEKEAKELSKGRHGKEPLIPEEAVAEIREIFSLKATNGYISRAAFSSMVPSRSMTPEEVTAAFNAHSQNNLMSFKNFLDILKASYPPYAAGKCDPIHLPPKPHGVQTKVNKLKAALKAMIVHTPSALHNPRNPHARQSRRLGKLTALSGCAQRVQKLRGTKGGRGSEEPAFIGGVDVT